MDEPMVSVLMPVYNAAAHLRQAVQSVLDQTFGDFEFLIINDGSTDESAKILQTFNDGRIRILNQENRGVVATLNRGINEARGQFIARMDSDDICLPDRLQRQVGYLQQHAEVALLGGFISTMDEDGNELAPVVAFPVTHEEIWQSLGVRPWAMCHPAVIFRRTAAVEAGLYHADFKHAEDTEFFARLMSKYRAGNLPEVVLKYRLRRAAVSMKNKQHGLINAQLVAEIIRDYKPGQPFAATAAQRKAADERIASGTVPGAGAGESAYHCRIARELLRARKWREAAGNYIAAARRQPVQWLAYAGLACAIFHVGAARPVNGSPA